MRPRQLRDAESCSDDGTAYQDGMQQSDVELSGEEYGRGGWDECEQEEAEDEHWGPQIATPKAPRHASYTYIIYIYIYIYIYTYDHASYMLGRLLWCSASIICSVLFTCSMYTNSSQQLMLSCRVACKCADVKHCRKDLMLSMCSKQSTTASLLSRRAQAGHDCLFGNSIVKLVN